MHGQTCKKADKDLVNEFQKKLQVLKNFLYKLDNGNFQVQGSQQKLRTTSAVKLDFKSQLDFKSKRSNDQLGDLRS